MKTLPHYLQLFTKLRRDRKNGGAPHKPILLLAVMELIRKGELLNNRVKITPELVMEFKSIWSRLVVTQHSPNFALPFYHMKTEGFWYLITNIGLYIPLTSSNSIKSLSALKEAVAYAELDKELFLLMQDPISRAVLEETLLETYFPESKNRFYSKDEDLFSDIEQQIVSEDATVYRERIDALKLTLKQEDFEEEIFVRCGVFKREIPKLYDYQCAISGMRIETTTNAQMVDACHIVPFAHSKDDTISNGISLSPNLHRAFDRGLITINEDYLVCVSPTIKEVESPYSISQFNGKQITLPSNKLHYPAIDNLNWHRLETFHP